MVLGTELLKFNRPQLYFSCVTFHVSYYSRWKVSYSSKMATLLMSDPAVSRHLLSRFRTCAFSGSHASSQDPTGLFVWEPAQRLDCLELSHPIVANPSFCRSRFSHRYATVLNCSLPLSLLSSKEFTAPMLCGSSNHLQCCKLTVSEPSVKCVFSQFVSEHAFVVFHCRSRIYAPGLSGCAVTFSIS